MNLKRQGFNRTTHIEIHFTLKKKTFQRQKVNQLQDKIEKSYEKYCAHYSQNCWD